MYGSSFLLFLHANVAGEIVGLCDGVCLFEGERYVCASVSLVLWFRACKCGYVCKRVFVCVRVYV